MPGRVLNFSEFFSKYSKDGENNQKSLADFSKASDSFQDAFDENSYKQDNLGPNKPVASAEGITPAQPGEVGAPKFTSNASAPSPEEESETPEQEHEEHETPEHEEKETPEQEEKEEKPKAEHPEEDDEEEKEEKETPEPENESLISPLKGFTQFINESEFTFGDKHEGSEEEKEEEEMLDDDEVICQSCGAHKPLDGNSPEEDSWFKGKEGMQCGCTM